MANMIITKRLNDPILEGYLTDSEIVKTTVMCKCGNRGTIKYKKRYTTKGIECTPGVQHYDDEKKLFWHYPSVDATSEEYKFFTSVPIKQPNIYKTSAKSIWNIIVNGLDNNCKPSTIQTDIANEVRLVSEIICDSVYGENPIKLDTKP